MQVEMEKKRKDIPNFVKVLHTIKTSLNKTLVETEVNYHINFFFFLCSLLFCNILKVIFFLE